MMYCALPRATQKMRCCTAIVLACALGTGTAFPVRVPAAQTYAELVVGNTNRSTGAAVPPGETGRVFLTEQWTGNIRVADVVNRTLLATPLLQLSVSFAPEQGVLGLAFDPKFEENGYFYVNYTDPTGTTRIERYRMMGDPATSNVADPASVRTILSIPQPQSNHNGGWLGFGPFDDYLYISTGDGGSGFDLGPGHTPETGNAQDITDNLLGKILRIDVAGDDFPADDTRNYAIPPTNPFVGKNGDDEIWVYGLRNPWRASFDRQTGDLWIGDVGQDLREEIDFLPAGHPGGANFGWRLREGSIPTPNVGGPAPPGAIEPIYEYSQTGDPDFIGGAVTGGYVYRGPVNAFQGMYFFADTNSGNIWTLDPHAHNIAASVQPLTDKLLRSDSNTFLGQTPSFTEDADGNLYSVQLFAFGGLFRVATRSQQATWNGDDPGKGLAGDGTSWNDARNWSRGAAVDAVFVPEDPVAFGGGSSQQAVDLDGGERLVAAASFTAPYTLHNGTLRLLSGNVTVAEGVAATIEADLAAETVHRTIRKLGLGRLVVEGHAGQTVVLEGALSGTGTLERLTVHGGAVVAPGKSVGIMTVDGSSILHAGSTMEIEIGGTDNSDPLAPQFDQLIVGGSFTAAGTLLVRLVGSGDEAFSPAHGDAFEIVSAAGGATGDFAEFMLPTLPAVLKWEIDRTNPNAISLRSAAALPGDYNADGQVDAADFVVWRRSVGQTAGPLVADGSGPGGVRDGVVDQWDYDLWRASFGTTIDPDVDPPARGVPEPASAMLSACGAALLLMTRLVSRWHRSGRKNRRG